VKLFFPPYATYTSLAELAHRSHGHSAALVLLDSVYASRPLWSNVAAHPRYPQAIVQATPAAEVPEGATRGESSSGNGYNRFLININTGPDQHKHWLQ
jgi:hypothetical protein